jgi:hypothetical protein
MGIKLSNNAFGTLAAGINSSATSITLTTGQGARFPSLSGGDYFYATLIDTSNNLEIVKCTARSTDVLTIVRAQESTTARAYNTGDRIEIRITAQTFLDAVAEIGPTQICDEANSSTGYFDLPSGTTAQRPASPGAGMIRHNTTTGYIEYYDAPTSQWVGIGAFQASGGSENTYTDGGTNYKSHAFTTSGTFTVAAGVKSVDVLIIGGGGGGGPRGGGGGAGGMQTQTVTVTPGTYTVTIGAGGAQSTDSSSGGTAYSGSSSSGLGYTSSGGGAGGTFTANGQSGGSGGGAGRDGGSGGAGTSGQGNTGGNSTTAGCSGSAGGGGKGSRAPNPGETGGPTNGSTPQNERGGNGGTAATNTYRTGSAVYYAGGGGGSAGCPAADATSFGLGGGTSTTANKGGAGDGAVYGVRVNTAATANTGGGGGGGSDGAGSFGGGAHTGAPGGSGIVVIRYTV